MSNKKKKSEIVDIKNGETIETIEWKSITYTCPIRGQVTQKVKVTRYKTKTVENRDYVRSSDPLINDFDMKEITDSELDDLENNDD